jgi:AcrR family transcriptional regulator
LSKEQLGEALRDLVVEKLTEKARKAERSSSKNAHFKVQALEATIEELSALDVWTRVPPNGRRPKLSREHLAATALRIADAEGMGALSMRRLATELDVGTMSLYHYVRTKDELLTLVVDSVMGEVVIPDRMPIPTDWRAALMLIATRSRAAMERHPWMLDINDDPPIGPNSVRHFDQSLQAVASLDLPLAEKLDIIAVVDEYAFGYSLLQRNNSHGDATDDDDEMIGYIGVLLETGAYPQLQKLTEHANLRTVWREVRSALRDERRFERNLVRILDGIEASLPS